MALVRPILQWWSMSSTRGTVEAWGGGGAAPVSLVNVTCIPRQCLVLGWLGNGFLARDQDGEWEWALPDTPISSGSFRPFDGMGVWPLVWRLTPDVWSSKPLDLAVIDVTVVAVNWNSRLSHTIWAQRLLQEIKNHWVCTNCIFSTVNGIPFIHHQVSLASVGMLLTWEKVIIYFPKPPDFGNLRDGHELSQPPLLNQTFRILLLGFGPTQGCQKCESKQGC